ncbi:uncharacterized protein LOC134824485 [Bolinopsis microptera]|uniref:uncharacterized protein LOC134824485 n=1 Tax=Bolinopsis microptera TaxID=2820187 RepID=UPI003079C513
MEKTPKNPTPKWEFELRHNKATVATSTRDEEDDEVRRQHRPAWEIAAEQHPALAMKNTARPPLPTPVHQTRVDYAKQYYRDRMAMFVGLVLIMIGVATWAIAVSHQSPISRWMGCVIIVVGVGWLIVDCINVKTRRKS